MMTLAFTQHDIETRKHEKESAPAPKVRRRCAIVSLKSQGYLHTEIERIVGIRHETVTNTLQLHKDGGLEALNRLNSKGQPREPHRFTEELQASLAPQPVSTYQEAKARINDLTKLNRSLTPVQHFLTQIGCTRRKVRQIPDNLEREKHAAFKRDTLEPLMLQAQRAPIPLGFVEAAHFVLRPCLGYLLSLGPPVCHSLRRTRTL